MSIKGQHYYWPLLAVATQSTLIRVKTRVAKCNRSHRYIYVKTVIYVKAKAENKSTATKNDNAPKLRRLLVLRMMLMERSKVRQRTLI